MYKIRINNIENTSQYEELIKEFLQPAEYEMIHDPSEMKDSDDSIFTYDFDGDKEALKREIYKDLSEATGKFPKWGVLTGIRPVKLAGEIADRGGNP
ncbi:MAG: hypothetical protein HUJ79_00955, partial [Firmicutes bacterium]|nr:hypothetical protein [Bacillota bacterium]